MEMPIIILDQQQAAVKTPVTNGTVNNAKQAGSEQKPFKSTFNKALGEATEKGKTDASSQSESETVKGEDKALEELLAAGSPPVAILNVVIQPVLETPVEVASEEVMPVVMGSTETVAAINTVPTMDNVLLNEPAIQAAITPVGMTLQNPDLTDVSSIPVTQSSAQEVLFAPVQNSNPSVNVEEAKPAELNSMPDQNLPLSAKMAEQSAATVKPNNETVISDNFVEQEADPGYVALAVAETADVSAPAFVAKQVKVEQPVVQKDTADDATVKEDAFTAVAVPVAGIKEHLSKGNGFNTDTAGTPSTMTPMGAVQPANIETVNTPFPPVEPQLPIKDQVVQEIVQKARFMSNGTQQTMQMQLKPENLGPLNVQIAVENGAVTAKFQTDNPQVKQALEASLNQLKQDLQAQGFKVQHVAVSIAQQGMSFSEFSRRSPQFGMIKSKRVGKVDGDMAEQFAVKTARIENYGGLSASEVDYKI